MSLYDRLTGLRQELMTVGIFSLFMNLLMLTAPIYMLQVFDRVLASGRVETLIYLTLIAAVALATYGLLEVVRGRMLSRLAGWVDATLSPDILRGAMAQALAGEHPGNRGLAELGQVRSFLGGNGINALFDAPWLPLFVAVIWFMHPLLGVVALTGALLLFGLALLNELATRAPVGEAGRDARRDEDRADAMLRNAHVVRAMGMGQSLMKVWRRGRDETIATLGKGQERNATFVGLSKALRLYLQVAILGVGAYLVLGNEITAGGMIAASILLSRALAPVEQSIGAWKQFIGARNAFRSLCQLAEAAPLEERRVSLPTPKGRLEIEQVAWAPPGADRPTLSQVSFGLQPGQTCGLIGPSASGKSTLCRMIVGAWRPSRGLVRLDGADVSRWDADDLGRHIGYLPQSVDLFPGTVAQNIARMGDACAEEIVRAAHLAGAHDMIVRLPQGYETDIGSFGEHLSGGQRQRLGLARALFGRPRLLVLDEPNANLDHEGEEALLGVLRAVKNAGTTVILVSHRAHILRDVDRIAVLDGGTLKMFGQREDVLAQLRPQRTAPVPAADGGVARVQPVGP